MTKAIDRDTRLVGQGIAIGQKGVINLIENMCDIQGGYGDKETGDLTLITIKTELWEKLKTENL